MFPRTAEWVPPASFPDLSAATEIAIDLETCDPNMESMGPGWPRKDGYIVGYAVAVDGWKGYFPIAHKGGGNLDERIVNRWMKRILELPCDKIMHNAAYDLGWLRASGFTVIIHAPHEGLPTPREPAFADQRSQDGEAQSASSERRTGCP